MIDKKYKLFSLILIILTIVGVTGIELSKEKNTISTQTLEATIIYKSDNNLTIQDSANLIYTFQLDNVAANLGDKILIEYTGLLDKNSQIQTTAIQNYQIMAVNQEEDTLPTDWLDEGIFSKYYLLAYNKLKTLSLEEKIGQLFLIRYPDTSALQVLKTYKPSGFVFYEKDFQSKTEQEVKNMISTLQTNSTIPLLTAVDEEGGKVVRVSSNSNLATEKFKSPQELYRLGGFEQIQTDTIAKSKLLKNLGLNLNLAPVVDASTNPDDYMYERTIGLETELTSTYAKTVIQASKGTDVSYTLKHFPGYGNNQDTHTSSTTDTRSYEEIQNNDLPPFQAGIQAGAEAVLVSHNTVTSIDSSNPASLSPSVHNILRGDLNFTGIIITDDLDMGAVSQIDSVAVKALLAGNDLIITTDYQTDITAIKTALNNGTINENLIDKVTFRILAWKYYKGLMFKSQK